MKEALPTDERNARYDPMTRDELVAECEWQRAEADRWSSIASTRNVNIAVIAEERDAERLKRQQLEGLVDLLREASRHHGLAGTQLRDRIYAALPDDVPAVPRAKTMMDHERTCAHFGDSCAPCTCGAEPDIVGFPPTRTKDHG